MERLKTDTVADLHRAMIVLREELETKNRIIMKLRRNQRPKCHKRAGNIGNLEFDKRNHKVC